MAGLSVLIAEWHCIQTDAAAMRIASPGSGLGWHILHFSLRVPACALWLKGSGCSGAACLSVWAVAGVAKASRIGRGNALPPLPYLYNFRGPSAGPVFLSAR